MYFTEVMATESGVAQAAAVSAVNTPGAVGDSVHGWAAATVCLPDQSVLLAVLVMAWLFPPSLCLVYKSHSPASLVIQGLSSILSTNNSFCSSHQDCVLLLTTRILTGYVVSFLLYMTNT
jgi:hypothetical protein